MADVEVHRVTEGRDDLLASYVAAWAETDAELNPGDPPVTAAELAGDLFAPSTHERRLGWVALDHGRPAGVCGVRVEDGENGHRADVEWLAVVPSLRRRGTADALLRVTLDHLAAEGRTSVALWAPVLPDGAGVAYARRLGATLGSEERCSRLRIADADTAVLEAWREAGGGSRDGYRLVQWTGPLPDEHVDLLVSVRRAMADMPTDDLDLTVPVLSEEDVRSFDASAMRRGLVPVLTVAVAPEGAPAGFSALFLNRHRPTLGWQGDTGVLAEHRGRGLGRWLKAENLALALAAEPRLAVVETYNAESNPWMLDINVAMGFRPHVRYQAWQASVADLQARLAG